MKLLVTGASGFVGSHVARAASRRGDQVRCLVRATSDLSLLGGVEAERVAGDLIDAGSLSAAVTGVDAVVHCAAITSEAAPDFALSLRTNVTGTQHLVDACTGAGVPRFVLVSTQSATEDNSGAYGKTKLQAERVVAASGLDWTILRPSTVYGPGARGLFAKIGRYVTVLPCVPVIGGGRQRFRPIHVDDLVTAILRSLELDVTIGRRYDLGGRDGVSFAQFIDGVGDVVGKRRVKIPIPTGVCVGIAKTLALATKNPPLTVDNVVGLTHMRECDISPAERDFGFDPLTFREGIDRLRQARVAF
jgi:nucleoside-diphosphate-sugar epimerase